MIVPNLISFEQADFLATKVGLYLESRLKSFLILFPLRWALVYASLIIQNNHLTCWQPGTNVQWQILRTETTFESVRHCEPRDIIITNCGGRSGSKYRLQHGINCSWWITYGCPHGCSSGCSSRNTGYNSDCTAVGFGSHAADVPKTNWPADHESFWISSHHATGNGQVLEYS